MWKSSDSQVFRIPTRIQSGPDNFDKPKFTMTFLTNLGITEILCSFQLVLEWKTGKEISESSRLEFLEKFSANNLALSDAEDNTSGPLDSRGIADLSLLRTLLAIHQKSWEPSFWEEMDSYVLVAYASLAASRTFFWRLWACLSITLHSEDLLCWYKWTNWFLWAMAAAQTAENHGDEWDSTWYLQWGIYTLILIWTHSQNSLAATEVLGLKIWPNGTSLKWSQRPSQLVELIIK